jgi:glycerol uptake facilitator-like aquaporin
MLRKLCAEAIGTLLLVATVVGSGIMANQLSGGIDAIALIGNTLATGCILFVLISILGPVSGAHFNPAVTLTFFCSGDLSAKASLFYVISQFGGGVAGTALAHVMFDLPILQIAQTDRASPPIYLAEFVATFGLIFVILMGRINAPTNVPLLVGLYISAGYWFTSSTSFANPAVTIARSFSDTFSGIAPQASGFFIAAQLLAIWPALRLAQWLTHFKKD